MSATAAWLYTRGTAESVRLDIQAHHGGIRLRVSGPGKLRSVRDFPDTSGVLDYQARYERHLLSIGYRLDQFTSDRRKRPR